jgi:hypothetical protein
MLHAVRGPRGRRSRGRRRLGLFAAGLAAILSLACPNAAFAEPATAKIAVALSLTGPNASIGRPDLEGARLAVEEANAAGGAPTIELLVCDDASNASEGARRAHEISGGDALLVLGPGAGVDQLAARQCRLCDRHRIRVLCVLRLVPSMHRRCAAGRAPARFGKAAGGARSRAFGTAFVCGGRGGHRRGWMVRLPRVVG